MSTGEGKLSSAQVAMITLCVQGHLPWLPVILITIREVGMQGYRSWVGRRGVSIPARKSAKIKTLVQDLAIGDKVLTLSGEARAIAWLEDVGIPAARLGVGYAAPGVKKLMEIVGPSFTKEIFFTARHFSAAEAREMGLVNRIVAREELEQYIRQYCATISDNAPLTMHTLKRTVGELLRGEDADLAACEALVAACFDSADYIEGRRAFMGKRRPVFRGV